MVEGFWCRVHSLGSMTGLAALTQCPTAGIGAEWQVKLATVKVGPCYKQLIGIQEGPKSWAYEWVVGRARMQKDHLRAECFAIGCRPSAHALRLRNASGSAAGIPFVGNLKPWTRGGCFKGEA